MKLIIEGAEREVKAIHSELRVRFSRRNLKAELIEEKSELVQKLESMNERVDKMLEPSDYENKMINPVRENKESKPDRRFKKQNKR